ncbi:MAG TPA: 2-amino-4-hydroxy-6-hydroxymethyldihydropteridine diphosphokinase [Verrucomicrobiae bacterium]
MNALSGKRALIALGSNLGDSISVIREACDRLQELSDSPIRKSSLWRTTPVDCPPGSPPFVNSAVALVPLSDETPESLLSKLQALENKLGRKPKVALNEPRPLDLDLIAFGEEVRNTTELTLPHPRAHLRRFVLQPLSEIAPDFVLPGEPRTVRELLEALPPDDSTRVSRIPDDAPQSPRRAHS